MLTSDEDISPDELGGSDDDGFVPKFLLANGRKRKLEKNGMMRRGLTHMNRLL
jgi:hypothetical protein